jgi:hypothetical protein
MNERLKKLTDEAGLFWQFSPAYEKCLERFAELVRQDEREACAALCDDWFAGTAGQAIRERGNK